MSFFVFIYILLSLIVNATLGAYLAIMLGYGPPTINDAKEMLIGLFKPDQFAFILAFPALILGKITALKDWRPWKREETVPEEAAPEPANPDEISQAQLDDMLQEMQSADIQAFFDDHDEEVEMVSPLQELFDDDLANVLMDSGTEAWLMNEKNVETSILKLNTVMMKSGRLAASLDKMLRDSRGHAGLELVESCRDQLREDCENYLETQAGITERIQKQVDEFGELKYIAEEVEYSNMEQAAQIETTVSNLNHMSMGDPEDGVNVIIKELSKLRVARHSLRDEQEKAFLTVSRYEKRLDTINQSLFYDELIGIRGRIGLEIATFHWWKQNRQQQRQLTFALIDLVGFGNLNDEHGISVCDALLKHLGRSWEKMFDPQDIVAVYNGNRFMVATVNLGVRKTITEIEKLRQQLERTEFTYNDKSSSFTVQATCALTEALPNHSDTDVFKAVEGVLKAAKKAGRNHTFYLDQKSLAPKPEPIEPPNFGAAYITVELDEYIV